MNRRAFLRNTCRYAAGASFMSVFAQLSSAAAYVNATGGYRALVCLQLAGGNDGNNTVIPYDGAYSEYSAGRGCLALPQSSLNPMAVSSQRAFALHPSLKNLAAIYNKGEAAILANAGPLTRPTTKTDFQTLTSLPADLFSHPSQQAEWSAGESSTGTPATGWFGRVADQLSNQYPSNVPMVTSTLGWTLAGQGLNTLQATTGTSRTDPSFNGALEQLLPALNACNQYHSGNQLQLQVGAQASSFLAVSRLLADTTAAGSSIKTTFPASSLGNQLQTVVKLINGRSVSGASRQMFVCQGVGFDTHADQLNIQAANLSDLDACLLAFTNALEEIGMSDQVTLFTTSDFARSHQSNSTGGSDHAWGNHHIIVGGSIRGGKMYGTFPSLVLGGDDDARDSGLWIPTTSGSQYAATMAEWFGVDSSALTQFFPDLSNFTQKVLPIFHS